MSKQAILKRLLHSLSHEAGHNLDEALGQATLGAGRRFSKSANWTRAIANDGKGMVSQYAQKANSPVEDFADSIAYFIMNKQEFTKTFPNRTKILKVVLKQ